MTPFDTVLIADWSAGKRGSVRPKPDAIWLGLTRDGAQQPPEYCRSRQFAEARIGEIIAAERRAGRRLLVGFDFPFGYPAGFAQRVTGSNDPLELWDWFECEIQDTETGENNRYDVAERINAVFDGPGPFWGKSHRDRWPGIPYRKEGVRFDTVAEKRQCDLVAKAASSCFQLAFPPTVGSQILMGLPTLSRLRRLSGVRVWPFEACEDAPVVLAEIWPGLIEPAVKKALQSGPDDAIRDEVQVGLLANALSRLDAATLEHLMNDLPSHAKEEAWILGAGAADTLTELAGQATPPPLRNDCFALPQGVHWTPVDEALDMLRTRLHALTGASTIDVDAALGRIAAGDVVAARANPPLPNTAVDGYGFAGGRGAGTHSLPLVAGRAAAGDAPGTVVDGHAIRILTGAALPAGVDTVILQEDVARDGDAIVFNGPLKTGANTRKAGEDVQAGDVVIKKGRRIGPADIALLSAVGVARIEVRDRLRVGVLSTGDELVDPDTAAAAGQIYDANRPMLLGLIKQLGHVAVDLGRAPDDRMELRRRFDDAAGRVDALLTSGGASAGDEDHVSALLDEAGAMATWRIAIKPGRPLALALWNGVPVFGLPGNPVAALVCALIFARPALAQLAGAEWTTPQGFNVPANFTKRKKPGRTEFLRARFGPDGIEVFPSEGSGRISGLSWADGLVELCEGERQIAPGDLVRYIPYASFGL
ncbi:gephyrin-like molybdotransferase Glp [Sulfitobacter sp. S190]|uniref:molybdopterin-binding protein n=1 Tax=Sulfitobacter sp. S190 TaxID=2867022 RepID=UPI0021A7CDD7|nr:gephyrin-like molybdotransferase Glp [Sulfitobacter sp. S190]UWR23092.1 molybdopterin molybdenumtransferase MoeA [Sulfitobacter sp. S190]